MHKSRLGSIIIDCKTDDLERETGFWSQALGCPAEPWPKPEDNHYIHLKTPPNEPTMEVQQVDHPSRVHIDIESDNIEAEVKRLESLGAKRLKAIRDWVVMEAPSGHRFCVVKPQRSRFEQEANVWDTE